MYSYFCNFNKVLNVTFFIVFTNKNGMDRFNPHPQIKKKENEPPNKTKDKVVTVIANDVSNLN